MSTSAYRQLADEDLIGLCLAGERPAWSALIRRYERLIYSIPARYGLSEADRLDVFQTVCVRLLEKLDTLRDRKSLAAWIISTTSRASYRAQKRGLREADEPVPASALRSSKLPAAEAQILEERALLRVALDRLPPRCRRLVELTFLDREPRSYREIAEELGIPEGSIGPTRARCLEKLRLQLRDLGLDA